LSSTRLARVGQCALVAAALMAATHDSLQTAAADGATRALSFHNTHTDESITVTFKRNGRYDADALKRLNTFLRDWRREEEIKMDPQLFDLLWEAYREAGGSKPIEVISGYRSPGTNAMLRARSSGVAQASLHTHGQAMDFFIPDVPLEKIREVGLKMQRGGVGFYPTSGSPFVHLDTGSIRHWPRMTHDQLVKVFPNERTVHIPSDGQPLSGYALAMTDVERQGRRPSTVSLVAARNANTLDDDRTASINPAKPKPTPKPTLLASFFGFKPGTAEAGTTTGAGETATKTTTASLTAPVNIATERVVPMPKMRPVAVTAVASVNMPVPPSRPSAAIAIAQVTFEADRLTTASTGPLLAYAPTSTTLNATRAAPMGTAAPKLAAAPAKATSAPAPVALAQIGLRYDDPWMRAMIMTPSLRGFLSTAQFGSRDKQALSELFRKPPSSVTMAFADEPNSGLETNRFSGSAVVFVATTSFRVNTALLRK
jgi:uncharacterized protein YcbK (DUF882 family)